MIKRDLEVNFNCVICGRNYKFFLNEEAYNKYINNEEATLSAAELFPNLMKEEIDLIETGVCEYCA